MMGRSAFVGRSAAMLALSLAAACGRNESVHSWLVCLDCQDGELDSAVITVKKAVDGLGDALLEGPPAELETYMRRQFEYDYRQLAEYAAEHPDDSIPVGAESQYVGRLLSNFVATYQARGAFALGRIRTPEALAKLRAVLQRDTVRDYPPSGPYREDVIEVVTEALGGSPLPPVATDAVIAGTVTDTLGTPLRRAQVYFRYLPIGAVTGGNGAYTIRGIGSGSYRVIATRIGYGPTGIDTVIALGDTIIIDFRLEPE